MTQPKKRRVDSGNAEALARFYEYDGALVDIADRRSALCATGISPVNEETERGQWANDHLEEMAKSLRDDTVRSFVDVLLETHRNGKWRVLDIVLRDFARMSMQDYVTVELVLRITKGDKTSVHRLTTAHKNYKAQWCIRNIDMKYNPRNELARRMGGVRDKLERADDLEASLLLPSTLSTVLVAAFTPHNSQCCTWQWHLCSKDMQVFVIRTNTRLLADYMKKHSGHEPGEYDAVVVPDPSWYTPILSSVVN